MPSEQLGQFTRRQPRLVVIARRHAIIVERHAIDYRDEEERPVRAALSNGDVARVVYGQEDVGCFGEVGEGFFEGQGVGGLH